MPVGGPYRIRPGLMESPKEGTGGGVILGLTLHDAQECCLELVALLKGGVGRADNGDDVHGDGGGRLLVGEGFDECARGKFYAPAML